MALSDDDKKKLIVDLMERDPDELDDILEQGKRVRDRLMDLNSEFPETRKFLAGRGLTHVSELDKKGFEELMEHLRDVLRGLIN